MITGLKSIGSFFIVSFIIIISLFSYKESSAQLVDSLPQFVKGDFTDDYGIKYQINDLRWKQFPNSVYHLIKVNAKDGYLIARNDANNKTDAGLFTRIDFIVLDKMEPFKWAFCLSEYKAVTDSAAENGYKADKLNPRKGCNGFPFSRMK
jgi:hypothetical protein